VLIDIFENFRNVCASNYDLDPAWYYTSPGLAWDAMLKIVEVELELLIGPDMLLMVEKGIRGGVSTISHRYGDANNPYMGNKCDKTKLTKYLTYLDANNLYGWAMSQDLPTGGFDWMTEHELTNWRTFSKAEGAGCWCHSRFRQTGRGRREDGVNMMPHYWFLIRFILFFLNYEFLLNMDALPREP